MISIFRHTFNAWRRPLLWTVFCLVLLPAYLLLFSPLGEMARLALPRTLALDLGTPVGWVGRLGFVLLFPLVLGGFAARMGSRLIAGEMEGGTLGLLLAQPVTRRMVLFSKILALLAMITILTLVVGLVILLGNWILNTAMPLDYLPGALLGLAMYAALSGFIALLIGCLSGSSRLSLGLVCFLLVLWLGLVLLAYLPSAWAGWPNFSPLYALAVQNPLTGGVALPSIAILAGLSLGVFLLAWSVFEGRDLEI